MEGKPSLLHASRSHKNICLFITLDFVVLLESDNLLMLRWFIKGVAFASGLLLLLAMFHRSDLG